MENDKKSNKGWYWLAGGLAVVGLGAGAYFLFGKGGETTDPALTRLLKETAEADPVANPKRPRSTKRPRSSGGAFPLRKGSKGPEVKKLQAALIRTYGRSILPKWGADGDYGSETERGLKSQGLPTTIDAVTFAKILAGERVQGAGSNTSGEAPQQTASAIARRLVQNIEDKKIDWVIWDLKQIRDTAHYREVSDFYRFLRGQRGLTVVSLLSAALGRFSGKEKRQLEDQFDRMGLVQSASGQWSLSGFATTGDGRLISTRTTLIQGDNAVLEVPPQTVLGTLVRQGQETVWFRTIDGQLMQVPTTDVRML